MKNNSNKPTFQEWTKDMSLIDQIRFYHDVDVDNCSCDPWQVLADCAENPEWIKDFKVNFKQALIERDYIK